MNPIFAVQNELLFKGIYGHTESVLLLFHTPRYAKGNVFFTFFILKEICTLEGYMKVAVKCHIMITLCVHQTAYIL